MSVLPDKTPDSDPSFVEPSPLFTQRVSGALGRFARGPFLAAAPTERSASGPGPIPGEALLKKALAALELTGTERVLELGSRTGYETALLCHLAERVVSLVPDEESAAARARLLASVGCDNVELVVGHGRGGWPAAAPYRAILVASGATHVPAALLDQLELGGRLVIPLGDASGQLLELLRHHAEGFPSQTLACCQLAMLPWASRRPSSFPWGKPT